MQSNALFSSDPPASGSAARTVLLAGSFGLTAGFVEALYLVGWHQTFRHAAAAKSLHALWMAPLAEFGLCVILGAALASLAAAWPRWFTRRVTTYVIVFAAALAVLLAVPSLQRYTQWLLAGGLAAVVTRRLGAREPRTAALGRCMLLLLATAVACGLGIRAWQGANERRGLAALPAAPPRAPNVLLITLDTVRARSLSLYGYTRRTSPELERLAERGVVFDRAVAPASWTLPSHASLFTGRFPHELNGTWSRPVDLPDQTLAAVLDEHGYETAGFVANLIYASSEMGLARGMLHYEDHPWSLGTMLLTASLGRAITDNGWLRRATDYRQTLNRKTAARLNDDFLRWESSRDRDRPFFAFLNYFDAHDPRLPPAPYNRRYGPTRPGGRFVYAGVDIGPQNKDAWSPADVANDRNAYDGAITYLDQQIGTLFSELERRHLLENTIAIVTADHGESFGEHGLYGHGNSLYFETLHVPLLVSLPGRIPSGLRVQPPVSLRDLPATIADLIGLGATTFPGESLAEYWAGRTDGSRAPDRPVLSDLKAARFFKPHEPTSRGDMASLVVDRFQYIRNGDGQEELYDVTTDPEETRNLANTDEGRGRLPELRATVDRLMKRGEHQTAGGRDPGRRVQLDRSTR
jgi:arylsulfatase A-like enzyme